MFKISSSSAWSTSIFTQVQIYLKIRKKWEMSCVLKTTKTICARLQSRTIREKNNLQSLRIVLLMRVSRENETIRVNGTLSLGWREIVEKICIPSTVIKMYCALSNGRPFQTQCKNEPALLPFTRLDSRVFGKIMRFYKIIKIEATKSTVRLFICRCCRKKSKKMNKYNSAEFLWRSWTISDLKFFFQREW